MGYDNFIEVPFTSDNLDRYLVRTSILHSINLTKEYFKGDLLDIGCGKMPYKNFLLKNAGINSYTGLDIETALTYDSAVKPDYKWDGVTMPFENNRFETAFGTEVLEHCPEPDIILSEVYRILKPAGVFFFTVPFLWPLHEVPHDEYRYTPFALQRHLVKAGFRDIQLQAMGGWHASLAQMLGLWIKRSSIGSLQRSLLTVLLKPIIKSLIKKDQRFNNEFREGQMITGLYGIAFK